jgi:hypothetical protein
MADNNGTGDDYKVGNKRPPKHTQFKKGKSGNPKGRKPGSRGLRARIFEKLDETVSIKQGDKAVKLSKGDVIVDRLLDGAMRDPKTATAFMRMIEGGKDAPSATEAAASPDFTMPNNETLKRIRDRLDRKLGGKS